MDVTVTHLLEMEKTKRSRNLPIWQKLHFSNRILTISNIQQTQFWVKNDSNSTFTAYIAANYDGSKEELIASKLGKTAEDITLIEIDGNVI